MDDGSRDGMATWASVKDQARTLLGIQLDDQDVLNLPLLKTDPYGKFLPGAERVPAAGATGQRDARGEPGRPCGRLAGRPDRSRLP